MLLSEKQSKDICSKLLNNVKANDAAVSVSGDDYSHLRFAANSFTTSGRQEDASVEVTVWVDKKRGSASTNATDDASLRGVVQEAERLARLSPIDKEYLPTLGSQTYKPVGGYVEATANISPTSRAKIIDGVIRACEKGGVIGAGFHQAYGRARAFATKNGNFDYERSSLVSLGLTARAPDGASSGYFLRSHFDVSKLDTERVAREAVRKAIESRAPRTIDAGVYPVILEPQAVADLLGFFAFGFDARSADEGRSSFSAPGGKTRLSEQIFDKRIDIYSEPGYADLPGSQSTQAGIPAEKIYYVRNGTVENLTYSRFWAQQKGKQPTPGPVNLIMKSAAPAASVEDMIKATDRGLLVSRFWYIRSVDPRTALFTGLTRDGVWYVEGGKVQYPVKNFRFNQSVMQLLAPDNVEMIGAPERVGSSEGQGRNSSILPALKVKKFNFTSQSEAV